MIDTVTVFNIRDFFSDEDDNVLGEDALKKILSDFSCKKNLDVERFLKEQAVNFTKKNQSVTYLVLSDEDGLLLGYFTLTVKPVTVNSDSFSNTVKKRIARVSEQDAENGKYSLAAYLIAQLGKNYANGLSERITGEELLALAINHIQELQYEIGGMVVFLETDPNERLLHFYENENGFKKFDTKEIQSGTPSAHTLVQLLKVL